jgi:hypothetical protein
MEDVEVRDYNGIPVAYCKQCLSLAIRVDDIMDDYCDECGCTDIEYSDIHTWESMYEKKYGKKFVQLKENKNGEEVRKDYRGY